MTKSEYLGQFQYFTLFCPSMSESPQDSGVTLYASLGDLIRTVFPLLTDRWDQGDDKLVARANETRDLKDQIIAIEHYFDWMQEADPSDVFVVKAHEGLDDPHGVRIDEVEDPGWVWKVYNLSEWMDCPQDVLFNSNSDLERQKNMAEAFEELGRLRRENERLRSSSEE